ncbi:hypothetical protein PR048_023585 [Dryococelus australis]|uniref:Uncharacterized protein n=1 Tax=Dryococelus australis TaxID=614101 RepID=A0ABQ9GUI6_9NEOP|nr:hypothetical protein PR048_023585 [Dryococelus australis]
MESQKVWLPDPTQGYVLGFIKDIGYDGEATIIPLDKKQPITCLLDNVYFAEEYDDKDVDDNCESSTLET